MPRANPRRSLESDLDAAEPSNKKAKARRQWKAGSLYLGLTYDLDKQTTTLLKFALSRASLRLRFIRFVAGSFSDKVWHIRRLVIPMFSWCGGFASLPSSDLTFLRKGIRQVFQRQLLHDTPDCVLSEILGWPTCPSFASQWAAILARHPLTLRRSQHPYRPCFATDPLVPASAAEFAVVTRPWVACYCNR